MALGLRTLTLQTGDEYKNKIGLNGEELAILIGSKAILDLHQQVKDSAKNEQDTGSESSESLADDELIFSGSFDEYGLDTVFTT